MPPITAHKPWAGVLKVDPHAPVSRYNYLNNEVKQAITGRDEKLRQEATHSDVE